MFMVCVRDVLVVVVVDEDDLMLLLISGHSSSAIFHRRSRAVAPGVINELQRVFNYWKKIGDSVRLRLFYAHCNRDNRSATASNLRTRLLFVT